MSVLGYGLIVVGLLGLVGGLAVTLVFEHRPHVAQRYGSRFIQDASMFGVRILGATLILFGAVVLIAAHNFAR